MWQIFLCLWVRQWLNWIIWLGISWYWFFFLFFQWYHIVQVDILPSTLALCQSHKVSKWIDQDFKSCPALYIIEVDKLKQKYWYDDSWIFFSSMGITSSQLCVYVQWKLWDSRFPLDLLFSTPLSFLFSNDLILGTPFVGSSGICFYCILFSNFARKWWPTLMLLLFSKTKFSLK